MAPSFPCLSIEQKLEDFHMRNRVKRFWAFVLAVSFCVVFSANAYAIQLRYINELVAMNEVGISGGKATMYSDVVCSSDVTKVVMTHVLQKKSGSTFSNVRNTTFTRTFLNNHAPDMEDVVNCTEPGTYRVKTTYLVVSPRGSDSHTQYSSTETI